MLSAGAGSYEPLDRHVLPVEPSAEMRRQRSAHLAPAIHAVAEALPFDHGAVDASMAMVTVHQRPNPAAGLREMRRVTRAAADAGPSLVAIPQSDGDFTILPGRQSRIS